MEYFEITIYPVKAERNKNLRQEIEDEIRKTKLYKETTLIEFFSEECKDFDEICISIPDYHFSQKDFIAEVAELSKFIGSIFSKNPQLSFATGIYELSFDYYESLKSLNELNKTFLEKFPIVFFNNFSDKKWNLLGDKIYTDRNVECVFNSTVQTIF
ncbi:MAG: hypothetical protein LBI13_04465 [Streptococcaceae bacterium]|jgi:hypothetical protein|nr:hypothetical protein [Streptococcaceae bacterium]